VKIYYLASHLTINVNLDEPFELGKCEINKKTDPKAVTQIYLYYAKKLNEYVNSKGKTMMIVGDVVSKSQKVFMKYLKYHPIGMALWKGGSRLNTLVKSIKRLVEIYGLPGQVRGQASQDAPTI